MKLKFWCYLCWSFYLTPLEAAIILVDDSPQAQFAKSEIESVASSSAYEISMLIDTSLGREGYDIGVAGKHIIISGGDPVGLMYGGLQIAGQIKAGNPRSDTGRPYIKKRGIKYNIPLDARTPSYDDTGDAAQKNIEVIWEWDYWTNFLDNMARNRYNLLTLWSMHPYPSWIKVPAYPDVALDDVYAFAKPIPAGIYRDWPGVDLQAPENLRLVKRISMDEKIAFWQKVFNYATDRGIDIYIFHWNIFVFGAKDKHGIVWSQTNDTTIDYFRQSVKQFLLTYPMVKGIGVTAGEHIDRNLTGKYSTENWMWLTYGRGIMDAQTENTAIDVRFIFRRHWSDLGDIRQAFSEYPGPFETSFKYARARLYSSTKPPWFEKIYRAEIEATGVPCWFNLRNDDIFGLRWGDPAYASEFVNQMPVHLSPGFYMGPDGYVWGREFTSKDPELAGRYEVEKHWYRFKIWGHCAYNPKLSPEYWQDQLTLRYPGIDGKLLYDTYSATSQVVSWINKVRFRQNDAMFSFEAGRGDHQEPDHFHTVDDFIAFGAMPLQGVSSIAEYARQPGGSNGLTPFEVAGSLRAAAQTLSVGASRLAGQSPDPDFEETLQNFQVMAALARYYAHKVEAATYLAMFRIYGNPFDQDMALRSAEDALDHWKQYARQYDQMYHPQMLARTAMIDPTSAIPDVERDMEIIKSARPGDEVIIKDDNFLWKRNKRRF